MVVVLVEVTVVENDVDVVVSVAEVVVVTVGLKLVDVKTEGVLMVAKCTLPIADGFVADKIANIETARTSIGVRLRVFTL